MTIKFPLETTNWTPVANDRGLFADTSDLNKWKDESISEIVKWWLLGSNTDNLSEWVVNKYTSNANISANPDVILNESERHTHSNKDLLDSYNQSNADITDLVSKKHSHTNKVLLDALTFPWDWTKFLDDTFNYVVPPTPDPLTYITTQWISITGQTIDGSVVSKDCVFFDWINWKKVIYWRDSVMGIYLGNPWEVAISGKFTVSWWGLVPGATYYLSTTGILTVLRPSSYSFKVWVAHSDTVILLDIDAEGTTMSNVWDFWYFVQWGGGWAQRYCISNDVVSTLTSTLSLWGTGTTMISSTTWYLSQTTTNTSKMTFSNETMWVVSATFLFDGWNAFWGRRWNVNSNTNWYISGWLSTNSTEIESLIFASETYNNTSSALSLSSQWNRWAQSFRKWYIAHTYNGTSPQSSATTLTFSSETTASSAFSIVARYKPSSGFSTSNWYWAGWDGSTEIDWVNFYNDTYRNPSATITNGSTCYNAMSSQQNMYSPHSGWTTNKFAFATETVSVWTPVTYTSAWWYPLSIPLSGWQWLIIGWLSSDLSSSAQTSAETINYSSDAIWIALNTLSDKRYWMSWVSSFYKWYLWGWMNVLWWNNNIIWWINYWTNTINSVNSRLSESKWYWVWIYFQDKWYFVSGNTWTIDVPVLSTKIESISFSDESVSTISAALTNGRWRGCSMSDIMYWHITYGLWVGWNDYRFSFSSQALVPSVARLDGFSVSDAATAIGTTGGYLAGGRDSWIFSLIKKFDWTLWSSLSATLSTTRESLSWNNSIVAGYFGWGDTSYSGTTVSTSVDKLTFSGETISTLAWALSSWRIYATWLQAQQISSWETSSLYFGYNAGWYASISTASNVINKTSFWAITTSTLAAVLSAAKWWCAGANSSLKWYSMAGRNSWGWYTNNINALTFSTDANASLAAVISPAKWLPVWLNSTVAWYAMGWVDVSWATYSSISWITFSTDLARSVWFSLVASRWGWAWVQNSTYWYVMGWWAVFSDASTQATSTEIDWIIFSSDTLRNPSSVLSAARVVCAGSNSSTDWYLFWWRNNAWPGAWTSDIYGINFSTEASFVHSSSLLSAATELCAVDSPFEAMIVGSSQVFNYASWTVFYSWISIWRWWACAYQSWWTL